MDRRAWISMIVAAGFAALAVACGSSTDTSSSNSSGSGGSSGSRATSGSGASGSSGTGVVGGSTSTGNAANPMNPAACPTTAPVDTGTCTMAGLDCEYAMSDCTCGSSFGGMMGGGMGGGMGGMMIPLLWNCTTMGGSNQGNQGQIMCPTAEPMNGSTCTPGRGDCMFGTRMCDCDNDTNVWACWDPADCPTTQPAEQAACDVVGMACEYGGGQGGQGQGGRNNNNDCDCTAMGWDCGGQFCPAAEPAAGGDCEGGDGVCPFAGRTCDCDSQNWLCWANTDCPATPPAIESACTLEGMICPYTGGECECQDDGWNCDDEVGAPDGPPADAGTSADAGDSGM